MFSKEQVSTQPIILQDPNPPQPQEQSKVLISDGVLTEIFSLLSIAASAGILWITRGLSSKLKDLAKKVEVEEEELLIPQEELERVKEILAQISILTEADRVTLGVFHNGVIGATGAHYDKLAVLAGYCQPGVLPLPELYKDIEANTLMNDLTPLFENSVDLEITRETAPRSCGLYMSRRDIHKLHNRLLKVGNLEIGVLSIHWCSPVIQACNQHDNKIKSLMEEITSIIQASRDKKRILNI